VGRTGPATFGERLRRHLAARPEKPVRVVEENEFARLAAACENPALRCLLLVAYRQGLRGREWVNLGWLADPERGVLHVVNVSEAGELTRRRTNRGLPMHPAVQKALGGLPAGVPKRIEGGRAGPSSPSTGRPWRG